MRKSVAARSVKMSDDLLAVRLAYVDPFTKKRVDIHAPTKEFLKDFGF